MRAGDPDALTETSACLPFSPATRTSPAASMPPVVPETPRTETAQPTHESAAAEVETKP